MNIANILILLLFAISFLIHPSYQKLHSPELDEAIKRYSRETNTPISGEIKQKLFKRRRGSPNITTLLEESDKFK